ncbi:MAG: PAS domain S-box protein [Burkholderiales bacterium]|nr:PAS domain S-box protein [Burkholderiales bacterium]
MKKASLYLIAARNQDASLDHVAARHEVGGKEFSSAFEHAAIGMALVAPDSRRLRVNKAFCTMLGYPEAELMSTTVGHITHPDDVAEDFRQRALCLSGARHTYRREKRYLHRDGRVIWGDLTCTLVRDDAGRPVHFISQVQDISQRKQAEQHLREAQALLHMAAQVGRLGAWAYEVGQPTVIWSEEACAIHEVRQGFAPTSAQALAFFAPDCRGQMKAVLLACQREGTPFDAEARLITAKGRQIWVRVIGEAEWDAQGRVRRVLGAVQDISEARRAAEAARLMAQRLSTTLESLTDAFFTIDRDWRFTYVNAQAERLTRLSRAELLGRRVFDMYPELAELELRSELERAMNDNVTVELEAYYPPFDIWVLLKAFPSEQGLAVDIKDVTERISAQREIMRLNAELEERVKQRTAQLEAVNKELEAFSYSIAHDLRAPLSSIDGFSQMLESTVAPELADRCRHYLRRIRVGVRQMGDLTDGLLALSNLSRTSLRSEPVDLAALARDAVAYSRETSPGRVVEVEIAPCLPVQGDPRLLAQVIGNLVGNAWKFTSRKEHARIEVGSFPGPDGAPVFFVRDNGAGFDMAYASRMFEAFQRMHPSAEFEGTGIGLAIVHKIVTRHGGRVWAEAAPDRGATFQFTLG